MTQDIIHRLFAENPDELWTREKILLKIAEEFGELCKALRKESRERQISEFDDFIFAAFCLAEREQYDVEQSLSRMASKAISFMTQKS